jgi:hypothetical protein
MICNKNSFYELLPFIKKSHFLSSQKKKLNYFKTNFVNIIKFFKIAMFGKNAGEKYEQ